KRAGTLYMFRTHFDPSQVSSLVRKSTVAMAQASACSLDFRTSSLAMHDAAHALDGFVDLCRVLESDGDRVDGSEIHGEFHGGIAIFRARETALAAELHADHAHSLRMHLFGVRHHFVDLAGGVDVPRLERVHLRAVVV